MAIWQISTSKIALSIAAVVACLAIGGGLFVWSGIYNVAASSGHLAITAWLLEKGMRQSVKTHSQSLDTPPLNSSDMIVLGAAHYQGGCAPCHGAPGEAANPIVQNMLPAPPQLSRAEHNWSPGQLFWIVKHGLKYTGMPAWVSAERDDEVWSVVAFLVRLPTVDAERYRALAFGELEERDRSGRELAHSGSGAAALSVCARCHGDENSLPRSRLVPILAGQSSEYMQAALRSFAYGSRHSGIMQPVAAELDEVNIRRISDYYSRLSLQTTLSRSSASSAMIQEGQKIATEGLARSGVPPCITCHSGEGLARYPKLAGQFREYLTGQLKLFQAGLRDETAEARLMTMIAQRLTAEQIEGVAAFFEQMSQHPPGSTPPTPPAE